jgi:hypothetical protein
MDELARLMKEQHPHAIVREHHLGDVIKDVPDAETLYTISPELETVVHDFFHNDLLLIGTPIKNFAPSVLLQIFFQKMRHRLLTFENDVITSRNFTDKNVMFVISGVSSVWKWRLMNQFVFFIQFNMLFDFWGKAYNDNIFRLLFKPQHKIHKVFIPNARKGLLAQRKAEITARMVTFAKKAGYLLLSDVERATINRERRFFHSFVQRRVRMTGAGDVFRRGAKLHRERKLRNQRARLGSDDMAA